MARSFQDFSESQALKPPRFNAHYGLDDITKIDAAQWKLELGGLIADKRPLSQLWHLPTTRRNA